jgi:hypothetical protein
MLVPYSNGSRQQYLEEAAIAAQDLKTTELCHLQEAIRSKHYGAVRQVGVTDAEILLDTLNGGGQIQGHTREALRGGHLLAKAHLEFHILDNPTRPWNLN